MKLIGIYPGNFQPPTKAHFQVYKRLRQAVGPDTFVATTDRTPTPDAPLNIGDKEQILVRHGIPASNIQKIQNWKQPDEIFHKFSVDHTGVIFALNKKEADEVAKNKSRISQVKDKLGQEMDKQDPGLNELTITTPERDKEVWLERDGKLNYFQPYKGNENSIKSFENHGYVMIIDDTKIDGKTISTANIRQVFGSPLYTDDGKKKFFHFIFGWFDIGLYTIISSKFKQGHQVASPDVESPSEEVPIASKDRNQSMTVPQARVPSTTFKENITKLVHEVLKEIMDEDIMSTSTTDSSDGESDTGMSSALDTNKKKSDNATQIKDLNQQKKEAEAEAKKNKQQRDQYSTVVKNYDAYQKKNDREKIDTVNRELRQPKQPIAPIA